MDRTSAENLLKKTFTEDFDQSRFSIFIKELFNDSNISPKSRTVWNEYKEYIESFQTLGSFKDEDKKIIDVLTVKLRKTSSRDRARVMQRNFTAKYLLRKDRDAALVAFYGDEPEDWRFSFVKLERSEEHTSELQSHSFISYAVFCLKKKIQSHSFKALTL